MKVEIGSYFTHSDLSIHSNKRTSFWAMTSYDSLGCLTSIKSSLTQFKSLETYLWPIQTNKHPNKKSRMKSCCLAFLLIVVS